MINWTAIATGGAAIATAVAAAFTAYMATQTKKAAIAAEKSVEQSKVELKLLEDQPKASTTQAEVAQRVFAQGSTPLLIPVSGFETWSTFNSPEMQVPNIQLMSHDNRVFDCKLEPGCWIAKDESHIWVVIQMRNVGAGVAVVRYLGKDSPIFFGGSNFFANLLPRETPTVPAKLLWPQSPVIASNESTYFVGHIDNSDGAALTRLQDSSAVNWAEVIYTDLYRKETYKVLVYFSIALFKLIPRTIEFSSLDALKGS